MTGETAPDPADRTVFVLLPEAAAEWEALLERPAQVLPGVTALLAETPPWAVAD